MTIRVFSFGGGVQSTAALVLAARKEIDFSTFLFANTGDDSENPDTLHYFRNVHIPFALRYGLEATELRYTKRDGSQPTLLESITGENRSIYIPVRMKGGAPGRRKCTERWKLNVVAKEVKRRGASGKAPAIVGLGISKDEFHRAKDSRKSHVVHEFPLLHVTRQECEDIIKSAGLPPVPKSSCWFCPFKRNSEWLQMKSEKPELFVKCIALENRLNEKRKSFGKDDVFLSGFKKPLSEIASEVDEEYADDCSGYCAV